MIRFLPLRWQARYWVWRCSRPLPGRDGAISSSWRLNAVRELRRTGRLPLREARALIDEIAPLSK